MKTLSHAIDRNCYAQNFPQGVMIKHVEYIQEPIFDKEGKKVKNKDGYDVLKKTQVAISTYQLHGVMAVESKGNYPYYIRPYKSDINPEYLKEQKKQGNKTKPMKGD